MARHLGEAFLTPPHAIVLLLAIAEATTFVLSARTTGYANISGEVLIANGALYDGALPRHEFYRLLAYGFLHANPLHLITNLISLALLGPFVEARLRSANFLVVYGLSLLLAGLASCLGHTGHFVSVGASGGLFGLLGSLCALWVLGKANVSPLFFAINLGLNLSLALKVSNIDQFAHAGGFVGGTLVTLALEGVARFNGLWLRCKFPDSVNLNLILLTMALALALSKAGGGSILDAIGIPSNGGLRAFGALALILVAIKACDLILARRRGVAFLIALLAALNAAAFGLLAMIFASPIASACQRAAATLAPDMPAALCANPLALPTAAAGLAFVLTLMLNAHDLARGANDKGFVAAGYVAERSRSTGL